RFSSLISPSLKILPLLTHLLASFPCTTSAKSLGDSQFAHPLGFSAWTPAGETNLSIPLFICK
ncbi:MAG: hypothetical protein ACK551_04725, partial [Vampirovibrionales bacterium]